jgi:chromosome segregation ATPase
LDEVVAELNNSNGVLACRNNNLEKEITDLRRKMEEHGYLLYRLEGSTGKLREEQGRYEGLKTENKRLVEREDRINLAEIERRYVKQTQTLIERDKEINVQLVNHEKEKNILIHLEKCLESVEGSIETLVGNILQEKKERKEELLRIDAARQQASTVNSDMIAAKKEKISSRNQLHNYLCKLEAIVDDVVHARSKH